MAKDHKTPIDDPNLKGLERYFTEKTMRGRTHRLFLMWSSPFILYYIYKGVRKMFSSGEKKN